MLISLTWEITPQAEMLGGTPEARGLSVSEVEETPGVEQKHSPPLTPWSLPEVAACSHVWASI